MARLLDLTYQEAQNFLRQNNINLAHIYSFDYRMEEQIDSLLGRK
jgi:hypothetical protein